MHKPCHFDFSPGKNILQCGTLHNIIVNKTGNMFFIRMGLIRQTQAHREGCSLDPIRSWISLLNLLLPIFKKFSAFFNCCPVNTFKILALFWRTSNTFLSSSLAASTTFPKTLEEIFILRDCLKGVNCFFAKHNINHFSCRVLTHLLSSFLSNGQLLLNVTDCDKFKTFLLFEIYRWNIF